MSSFADALKANRRGAYLYGKDWRTLIVAKNYPQAGVIFNEMHSLFDASSLKIDKVCRTHMRVTTEKGNDIDVRVVNTREDMYKLAGLQFTHIIFAHEPSQEVAEYLDAMLRSSVVPCEDIRTDNVDI